MDEVTSNTYSIIHSKYTSHLELILPSTFNRYFLTVDWDELHNACAPFVPELPGGEEDVSNFEPNRSPEARTELTELSSPRRRRPKNKEGEEFIVGYSYIGKCDGGGGGGGDGSRFSLLATPSRGTASDAAALASLRRENEDLRLKLSRSENALASHRETSMRESSEGHQLRQLCEQESNELRKTITKLERLLAQEKEERSVCEKKTLELLTDVKTKWQQREEARVEALKEEKEKAEADCAMAEKKLVQIQADFKSQKDELASVTEVKGSLKAKLKECKAKLVEAVAQCEKKAEKLRTLEKANTSFAETSHVEKRRLDKMQASSVRPKFCIRLLYRPKQQI